MGGIVEYASIVMVPVADVPFDFFSMEWHGPLEEITD